jgi:hypothetical protein
MSLKAYTNIPQGVTHCELAKKELKKLILAIQISNVVITVISFNTFVKLIPVYKLHHLSKNIFS